ncbi:MAG: hypothetical protein ABSG53_07100 [Thermoguttaceae bacterium]
MRRITAETCPDFMNKSVDCTMKPISFPVWLYVNQDKRPDDGYPYYPWMRGGEPTPLPATLPVFSTEKTAGQLVPSSPFKMVKVDSDTFCHILKSCRNVQDVVLDLGTDGAVPYRVEELLDRFGSDSAS